ncbi:hypothetical protein [Microbacterium sp. XT11]|uniref:hypothetical protein n=1 Tax=Microbacterium sp. XT11 TaxID=367477 RepID=UPI000742E25A|nr:hypothetical protein [Microbacterium sp. XT11]ALX66113.1 hypothetical protein AB663_001023 [Microbacterium sp. XT11]
MTALRVAFAGLAHSHPFTDAQNVLAQGGEVVAVHDADPAAAAGFAGRFDAVVAPSTEALASYGADLVIATPRWDETVPALRGLTGADAAAPVFVNKTVAATPAQVSAFAAAVADAHVAVGTSSVLRFAPAVVALAEAVAADRAAGAEVLAVRVHAQHDAAAFRLPGREWQDDPERGGGTLVTVGVHAWEMVDAVLPGAALVAPSGSTRRIAGSATRSEDLGVVCGMLEVPGAAVTSRAAPPAVPASTAGRVASAVERIPVQVLVSGVPGPDAYRIEVVTAAGVRAADLDVDDANESLGFAGLVRALRAAAGDGRAAAPWSEAEVVVRNTVTAAMAAREGR